MSTDGIKCSLKATEYLSYDAVISVLLQTLKALEIIKECIPGNWPDCIDWTNDRLKEVWQDSGSFPGLGSILCAVGFKFGIVLANEIKRKISDGVVFEEYVAHVLQSPEDYFNTDIAASIGRTEQGSFSLSPATVNHCSGFFLAYP